MAGAGVAHALLCVGVCSGRLAVSRSGGYLSGKRPRARRLWSVVVMSGAALRARRGARTGCGGGGGRLRDERVRVLSRVVLLLRDPVSNARHLGLETLLSVRRVVVLCHVCGACGWARVGEVWLDERGGGCSVTQEGEREQREMELRRYQRRQSRRGRVCVRARAGICRAS